MAQSAEAYVDTSAFIAFADRSDTWPPAVCAAVCRPAETGDIAVGRGRGPRVVSQAVRQDAGHALSGPAQRVDPFGSAPRGAAGTRGRRGHTAPFSRSTTDPRRCIRAAHDADAWCEGLLVHRFSSGAHGRAVGDPHAWGFAFWLGTAVSACDPITSLPNLSF